jgi:hypothetical protein
MIRIFRETHQFFLTLVLYLISREGGDLSVAHFANVLRQNPALLDLARNMGKKGDIENIVYLGARNGNITLQRLVEENIDIDKIRPEMEVPIVERIAETLKLGLSFNRFGSGSIANLKDLILRPDENLQINLKKTFAMQCGGCNTVFENNEAVTTTMTETDFGVECVLFCPRCIRPEKVTCCANDCTTKVWLGNEDVLVKGVYCEEHKKKSSRPRPVKPDLRKFVTEIEAEQRNRIFAGPPTTFTRGRAARAALDLGDLRNNFAAVPTPPPQPLHLQGAIPNPLPEIRFEDIADDLDDEVVEEE